MEQDRLAGDTTSSGRPSPLTGDRADVEPERREAVRTQIEAAVEALDELVASAPNDGSRSAALQLRGRQLCVG